MAVMEAQAWCDKLENREEMCRIVGTRAWFNVPVADILPRQQRRVRLRLDGKVVKDSPGIMKFWRDHASFPFKSHDLWFVAENIRWGKFEPGLDAKALVDKVNRADLWREAAKTLGVAAADIPASDSRGQGDLLRRQGLRSRRPGGPTSPACRSSASPERDRPWPNPPAPSPRPSPLAAERRAGAKAAPPSCTPSRRAPVTAGSRAKRIALDIAGQASRRRS